MESTDGEIHIVEVLIGEVEHNQVQIVPVRCPRTLMRFPACSLRRGGRPEAHPPWLHRQVEKLPAFRGKSITCDFERHPNLARLQWKAAPRPIRPPLLHSQSPTCNVSRNVEFTGVHLDRPQYR